MESYIPISFLNDFIFCPRSIYFHQLYGNTQTRLYQTSDQIDGKTAHITIDQKRYSTRQDVIQSLEIYSQNYHLCGKIDLYFQKQKLLVERKKKIKVIYDGYVLQLYAQYYAMVEMGYEVERLQLYSTDTNKSYPVPLPGQDPDMCLKFEETIKGLNQFNLEKSFVPNPEKCARCIYRNLCDRAAC